MPEVFTTITLDRLESLLDEHGVVAKREQLDDEELLKFNAGPFRALILPYGGGPDYFSLQFRAGFNMSSTLELMNAWNRDNRYGKAYLDDAGEPILEYDLDLEGGSTESTVVEAVRTFRALVTHFASKVLEA
ncbi:MAG: YbjN domain-containing protein [Chitinophagaceae bacterium]|nr:YbjN domain-containing protein [Chitinophagaceae bacterium]